MVDIPQTPENIEIVEAATAKIRADEKQAKAMTKVVSAIALKHRLFGFSALVLGIGAAIGISVAGYSYYLDRQADLRKPAIMLSEALSKALSAIVLPVRATGTVDLDTSKAVPVKLNAQDSTVPLDTRGAVLRIEDSDIRKVVEVVGRYLDRRSVSPAAGQARTSLDVVKSARSPSGLDVVTRWEYAGASNGAPGQSLVQRCFVRLQSVGTSERLLEIARDEHAGNRLRDISEQQFQEALRYCIWSVSLG